MFKRINNPSREKSNGMQKKGSITCRPCDLVELFGIPNIGDYYKVSGEYFFKNKKTGEVFSLCDWKETTLYHDENRYADNSDYYTPTLFWASEDPYEFIIRGKTDVSIFIPWLKEIMNDSSNDINFSEIMIGEKHFYFGHKNMFIIADITGHDRRMKTEASLYLINIYADLKFIQKIEDYLCHVNVRDDIIVSVIQNGLYKQIGVVETAGFYDTNAEAMSYYITTTS